MEKLTYRISSLDQNQRIDKYLKKQLSKAPLNFIYRLFRLRDVRVNGIRVSESYILNDTDEITIYLTSQQKNDFITPYVFNESTLTSPILFENEHLLVINKQRGLLVHSDINEDTFTLSNQVLTYLVAKGEFDPEQRSYIPSPVGRIDKNTSGVVVFAKTLPVNQTLSAALARGDVKRIYLALVYGKTKKQGTIDVSLVKDNDKKGLVSVADDGKSSITHYKLIQYVVDNSLVEIKLETGRSNQIRVHFAHIGHPILGDHKYGKEDQYQSLCLHHHKLQFINLEGDLQYIESLQFVAPLPSDMEHLIKKVED